MWKSVNLLSLPEFRDVDRLKGVISAIETNGVIQTVLAKSDDESNPTIRIDPKMNLNP